MKKLLFAGALTCCVIVVVHYTLMDGVDGLMASLLFDEDTQYANGYSDKGFRAIRIGASKHDVLQALNEPLSKRTFGDDRKEYWYYSTSPTDTHYRQRIVIFAENDIVIRKYAEFYVD